MIDAIRNQLMTPIRRRRRLHYFLRNLVFAPTEWFAASRVRRGVRSRAGLIVFIIGCSRSGTSFTARMLNSAGLLLPGAHQVSDEFNPDGYFEETRVISINSDILMGSGGHWFRPPKDLSVYAYQRARIIQVLADLCNHAGVVGWKDPRGTLTMSAWLDAARELDVPFHVVGVFRNPTDVASSVRRHERGAFDFNEALHAWCVSNTCLLDLAGAHPDCFSWFTIDQPAASAEANLNGIARRLGLSGHVKIRRSGRPEAGANLASAHGEAVDIYCRLRAAHTAQWKIASLCVDARGG